MNYLAIDTSGVHVTVLIIKNGSVFLEYLPNSGLKHSSTLMPLIEQTLIKAQLKISEIDVFAAVTGPGSFTGIRIGVATAKAFSYAFGKNVLPVTSFEVLAYNNCKKKRLAVVDAMHGNYYVQGFDGDKTVISPCFIDTETLLNYAKDYEILSAEPIEGVNTTVIELGQGLLNAVLYKKDEHVSDREALIPLYVKKSQAEESAV